VCVSLLCRPRYTLRHAAGLRADAALPQLSAAAYEAVARRGAPPRVSRARKQPCVCFVGREERGGDKR